MLLLDSAQWLDNASWSLLSQVCTRVPGLLVCVMVRPSKSHPLDYLKIEKLPTTTTLVLEPLRDPSSTAKLVHQWSSLDHVPSTITDQIHKKAQGNPFVTQEMVTLLFVLFLREKKTILTNFFLVTKFGIFSIFSKTQNMLSFRIFSKIENFSIFRIFS